MYRVLAHTLVQVVDGVFSVLLGSLVDLPPAVLAEDALRIGVTVGADTEISPRLQVTSTPWAYRAAIADSSVVTGAGGGEGGTVFMVGTGSGLTGGPITTTGTISVASGGITNSHLGNNVVTGAKIVDGTILAQDIAAGAVQKSEVATAAVASDEVLNDSLYDIDLKDEPGVASVNNLNSVPIPSNTDVVIATRTITAPTTGFILANASAYCYFPHITGTASSARMSISTGTIHNFDNDVYRYISSSIPTGHNYTPMSCTDVFSVAAGSHTFRLIADADFGDGNEIRSQSLNLLFVPTSYGSISKNSTGPVEQVIED